MLRSSMLRCALEDRISSAVLRAAFSRRSVSGLESGAVVLSGFQFRAENRALLGQNGCFERSRALRGHFLIKCSASTESGHSKKSRDIELISPQEANDRLSSSKWTLLDVRSPEEYSSSHVPPSLNAALMIQSGSSSNLTVPGALVPNPKFTEEVNALNLSHDTPLLVLCGSGKRSAIACKRLRALGFTNIADISGGFMSWRSDSSLPTS
eukprot:CAMPEP_0185846554 /NCGR_PEP_ID=MMETSP1354-20130828/2145_1 /TAXON_ID=708628 /ORGANISM="Erythrolobus madagascarensis, Strain CCMP3276" /LENGTH=209 /DNA_ID=CAMNT_0028546697 /DNA_START=130 /DNA_END=760 /DNA_ORIENTATION=+